MLRFLGVKLIWLPAPGFQVLRFGFVVCAWCSVSRFDLRRKGLFEKKPERFFWTDFSGEEAMPGRPTPLVGGMPFVGELFPDIGSALV